MGTSIQPDGTPFRGLTVFKSTKLKVYLMWLGIAMGVVLILISLFVDIWRDESVFSWSGIRQIYRTNPTHWIILTSPAFLGAVFFVMGRMISEREQRLEREARHDHEQFAILQSFIEGLHLGDLQHDIPTTFDNEQLREQLNQFRRKLLADRVAEERRVWESEGLARFGDLLRAHTSINDLALEVVRFLTKRISANQGSVFIANPSEEGMMLELKACYAYDRKKYVTKQIEPGQGLVGQVFLEKETTLLKEIPKNYIHITSGLGDAPPSFIAIVPIKTEDEVNGVLEVASFTALEDYQIRFLELACQAFATVIASVSKAQHVQQLLNASQQQTEELRSQEEELRQNMEELQAVQEQLTRQLDETDAVRRNLEIRERVLELTTILSETDVYGTITHVNDKFCEVSQYTPDELIGKPHKVVRHPDMPREIFRLLWATIKSGKAFRGIIKNRKKDGTHYWVDATIVPILENGRVVKYIGARYHLEDEAVAQQLYEDQLRRLGIGIEQQALRVG